MNRRTFLATFLAGGLALLDFGFAEAVTRNVKDYGAKGNGWSNDTTAIRNAIAACNAGDVLQFPAGTYRVTGEIKPKSNMTLDFLSGAKLLQAGSSHLLVLDHVTNVVTQNMRLRHNGTARTANPLRIDGADNCYLYNTTIERTDAWNCYLLGGAHHITLDGMTILKGRSGNIDDGVDFAECHDCTLLRPDIHTNDDAISFKSYDNFGGTHHITVQNGRLRSDMSAAIGFGYEVDTDLNAILVDDIEVVESMHGVYFKFYDPTGAPHSGRVFDVEIRNIDHHDSALHWPQNVMFAQNYEPTERTANISIHDYTYVGEPYDAIHLMRVSGFTISNFSATWPAQDGRYPVWLEDAHDNSFNCTIDGSNGQIRQDGNCYGNTFTGVYS